jgi:hypothetical protein
MHPWNNCLNMTLGSAILGIAFLIAHPINVMATDTIDPATQPHLKSWSNVIPAAKRFVILADFNNEAVLDRETGLVWERSPSSNLNYWAGALSECVNKVVGGRKGWRLPSVHELSSLLDPSVSAPGPILSNGHPFLGIIQESYWTAPINLQRTTSAFAWIVNFSNGTVEEGLATTDTGVHYVWCVRGAAAMGSPTH